MFKDNKDSFSWKKFWFQVASAVTLPLGVVLVLAGSITGWECCQYYMVIGPAYLALYVYGKKVDNGHSQKTYPKFTE